ADVAVPPLIPRLAESWQVGKDGLTRTFKLRKGIKFHDGTPFNAQAAVFSWERMFKKDAPHFYPRANSYTSYVVEYITGAEAVDEYTLKLTFSKPYAEWERMTLQSWGEPMMVSPTQVKKLGNEKFANGPVGTGPFKFVENVPGDRIVLERFKGYWGPQANVDKLVFRRLDDPAARDGQPRLEHGAAGDHRLRSEVQAVLLQSRARQAVPQGGRTRQRVRDRVLDVDLGLGPDDSRGDGGVDPARPRQGGHPGEA